MGDFYLFSRFGLTEEHRADCHVLLRAIFPNHELTTHKYQGYCSYTVLLSYRGVAQGRGPSSITPQSRIVVDGEAFEQPNPSNEFWNQCLIVQFRPPIFALDIQTTNSATAIYGAYAPSVRQIGQVRFDLDTREQKQNHRDDERRRSPTPPTQTLSITAQPCLPGLPYSAVQIKNRHLSPAQLARQKTLVRGFAAFLARGWPCSSASPSFPSPSYACGPHPLPMALRPGALHAATPSKLGLLSAKLPTAALRNAARQTLEQLPLLQCLPLALNHGDVVPGNVMVGEAGELTGLVDWAEAEVGRWGVPLYGVEFLLGWVEEREGEREGEGERERERERDRKSEKGLDDGQEGEEEARKRQGDHVDDDDAAAATRTTAPAAWAAAQQTPRPSSRCRSRTWTWTYYSHAPSLRALFYATLLGQLAPPSDELQTRAMRVARDVGVLLWFGFAWDEGDIGRVVERGRDAREVVLLEAFLGVDGRLKGML